MTREEFIAGCDWRLVRADLAEHRTALEMRISQTVAEIRGACRPPRRQQQEQMAAWQDNIEAVGELLATLDREGV
jgi:hypothetical protein